VSDKGATSESDLPPQYLRGIEHFNAGEFFECHEALEEIWLPAQGIEREFLHAIIQSAVALHHYQRGNFKGASSVYQRASRKLRMLPPQMMRLNVTAFARQMDEFFAYAFSDQAPPSLPRILLGE
jgi:predicted metal-dependent hydrolase